jgi:hypothetical protein
MDDITIEQVRDFLITKYAESMRSTDSTRRRSNFDFLLSGPFGLLELISSIEQQFGIELDLANLDAEQMSILGSSARYVAEMRSDCAISAFILRSMKLLCPSFPLVIFALNQFPNTRPSN